MIWSEYQIIRRYTNEELACERSAIIPGVLNKREGAKIKSLRPLF